MKTLREAAQMALDALEHGLPTIEDFGDKEQLQIQHKAISALYEALRARLAQPEPWVKTYSGGKPNYTQPEQVAQFKFQEYGPPNWGDFQVTKSEFVAEQKAMNEELRKMVEQEEDYDAIANKQLASLKAAAKVTFEDAVVRAVHKLYNAPPQPKPERYTTDAMKIKQAVSEAVLQQAEQEPTAYLCENAVGHKYFRWKKPSSEYKPIALYTAHASPQRIWQGLTDEEIKDHWITCMWKIEGTALPIPEFARAIEDKLKEKNSD